MAENLFRNRTTEDIDIIQAGKYTVLDSIYNGMIGNLTEVLNQRRVGE
ncbi:MAG TPA: hypothetical protein VH796_18950 [Nitrososphaeraceae archaeon]